MFYILATVLDAILTPVRRTSEQQPQGSRREITVIYGAIYDPFSGGPTQTPIIEGRNSITFFSSHNSGRNINRVPLNLPGEILE